MSSIQLSNYSGGICLSCGNKCHARRIRCAPCGNKQKKEPVWERFFGYVNKTDTCWLWNGATTRNGYGHFWFQGKLVYSHRFSYEMSKGAIPAGLNLDHLCRTPSCVNPEHLEAVTQAENMYRSMMPNFITRRRKLDNPSRI